jgi:LacI family transcriptional regulator, repressor for deo operon, udp, cdd, tsx, nupC, and nupG
VDSSNLATIAEIAAALGVSKSTVSRALRAMPGVSPETIETVRRTAQEMGYIPSGAAVGLSTGRNHAVGVLVPALGRWFFDSVVTGVGRVLAAQGYDVVLFDLDRTVGEGARVFVRSILRRRVDALVVVAMMFSDEELAEFALLDIPIVAVGPPTAGVRTIGVNDAAVMTAATEHVLGLGHRRLGFIGGYDNESPSVVSPAEREHAFMTTAMNAGAVVEATWMLSGRYRCARAREVAAPLFRSASWPTAMVCASDEMAIGVMLAIQEAGLRVPQDVSVIGVDDHELAEAFDLTTCRQDPQAQGEIAARQVLAEVDGAPRLDAFPPADFSLVVRGTTAPPHGSR